MTPSPISGRNWQRVKSEPADERTSDNEANTDVEEAILYKEEEASENICKPSPISGRNWQRVKSEPVDERTSA